MSQQAQHLDQGTGLAVTGIRLTARFEYRFTISAVPHKSCFWLLDRHH